jgi:hypothetical protein
MLHEQENRVSVFVSEYIGSWKCIGFRSSLCFVGHNELRVTWQVAGMESS